MFADLDQLDCTSRVVGTEGFSSVDNVIVVVPSMTRCGGLVRYWGEPESQTYLDKRGMLRILEGDRVPV